MRDADTVITIGGMDGTYQGGLAAIVARKNLVPVAAFGGASQKLSAILEASGEGQDLDALGQLNGGWTRRSADIVMRLARVSVGKKILLIHGRSDDWYKLKDWLQSQSQISDVTVLQQQPGAGRTLPEKFEQVASKVDMAIAIATPDDVGALAGESVETLKLNKRARQNVWLEVGWFWGRLGRRKC